GTINDPCLRGWFIPMRWSKTQIMAHGPEIFSYQRRLRLRWLFGLLLIAVCAASAYAMIWYHRFYHHVTPQELSHQLVHSTFQADIRNGSPVTLQVYQQENARNQQLVFFTSGDGGWSPFCADTAAHIAMTGKTVIGFNVKDYLVSFASSQ